MARSIGALPVVPGDHVRFTEVLLQVGNGATLDTTSPYSTVLNTPSVGRILLLPGTYHINASVLEIGTTGIDGITEAALMNSDTGVFFNPTGLLGAGPDRMLLKDQAVISITAPTRIELNFVFGTTLNSYAKAFIEIEQLA